MRATLCGFAVAILVWGGAAADGCTPTTSTPILTLHWVGGNGLYVTAELACVQGVGVSCDVIVYEEANGIAGLQRSDDFHDDTCGGAIASDHKLA